MNEPEKQHVLEGKCVIEADLNEFGVILKAVSYAAGFDDSPGMRQQYYSVLHNLIQMNQTYQLAIERWSAGDNG